jgi:prepilin-type N-terminal cleavage/methylation domain-containing protein
VLIMMRNRRGFSLGEVMVALVIVGIVGAGMTRVLLNQNRFFDQQTNLRTARGIARNSMNVLMNDLRMAQDSGSVDSVSSDGKLMRIFVPYRFGLVCGTNTTTTTVSMLPTDSGSIATSVYDGFAFRNTAGRYTYIFPSNPTAGDKPVTSITPSRCTGNGAGEAQINTVSLNGRTGDILDLNSPVASGATAAAPVFFFQKVTYSFATSALYPTRLGLWRSVAGGVNEEIMAPFDAAAKFAYYRAGDDTAVTTPPAVSSIVGVDVQLTAVSPNKASNGSSASRSKTVTSIFFKNVRAY